MTRIPEGHALPTGRAGASDGTVATMITAVQTGVVLTGVMVVGAGSADPYDRPDGPVLGLLFLVVSGPPLMAVVGALHTFAVTMPADLGACAVARRLRTAPEWLVRGAVLTVLGALYAVPLSLLGIPYVASWAAIAASGVLPLLGVAYSHRRQGQGRPFGFGGVLARTAGAGFVLLVATVTGCGVAVSNGWVGGTYEVPDLSAREVAGVWTSKDGPAAGMRLGADGKAVLTGVPYPAGGFQEQRCDGEGTWSYTPNSKDVRGSVEFEVRGRESGDCDLGVWTVGGTTEHPELYALFGDPDDGDVRVLVRRP